MSEIVIEMRGITKRFPRVLANDKVDFSVYKGEIHALVGENGAGKTTLMNILYGLYRPDEGEIYIRGKFIHIANPHVAIENGIGMVHQHFMLVEPLTVAENVILGNEPKKRGFFIDRARAEREVQDLSNRFGFNINPRAKVSSLSVGIEQQVEIIKVLYRGADILILDEPTAVLTPQEVEELFSILRSLRDQGKTIIFITHKLQEVIALADRVTVMRQGRVVGVKDIEDTTREDIARMMVGREVFMQVEKGPYKPNRKVLRAENLEAMGNQKALALRGVSFEVREGEILGIAGVEGNGQTELVEVITGLRPASRGRILLYNIDITNLSPRRVREAGIAHIPENRRKRGLILDYSVADNLILGDHYRAPYAGIIGLKFKVINDYAEDMIEEFDIRTPDEDTSLKFLSGGNQQKVIVARELSREPSLLIAAQPTRGLDIGAIEYIHHRLIEQRDQGKAILLVSADLTEVMSLSDRIAVMYKGEIVGVLSQEEATEEELGLFMTGVKRQELVTDGVS